VMRFGALAKFSVSTVRPIEVAASSHSLLSVNIMTLADESELTIKSEMPRISLSLLTPPFSVC
jgi:hypothetical protein